MSNPDQIYDITPVTVTTITVITKFAVKSIEVKLTQSANILVDLLDKNNNYAGTESLEISGNDYANWGTDDDYLINWIKNNLNIKTTIV